MFPNVCGGNTREINLLLPCVCALHPLPRPSACCPTDLAVVKVADVPSQMLRPLPLGASESGRLRVGQLCLAIGNRE